MKNNFIILLPIYLLFKHNFTCDDVYYMVLILKVGCRVKSHVIRRIETGRRR